MRPMIIGAVIAVLVGFAAGFGVGRALTVPNPLLDAPLGVLDMHARVVPSYEGGQLVGMKIFSIRPTSALLTLGFQNGDVIVGVGDRGITTYGEAAAALQAASGTTVVHVKRRGQQVDIPCDACLAKLVQGAEASREAALVAAADGSTVDTIYRIPEGAITRIDEVTFEVKRSAVDHALAHMEQISEGARIVPAFEGGKTNGFKFFSVRGDSLYWALGLQNGDTITHINDIDLSATDHVSTDWPTIWQSNDIVLVGRRRGQPLTLTYHVK